MEPPSTCSVQTFAHSPFRGSRVWWSQPQQLASWGRLSLAPSGRPQQEVEHHSLGLTALRSQRPGDFTLKGTERTTGWTVLQGTQLSELQLPWC